MANRSAYTSSGGNAGTLDSFDKLIGYDIDPKLMEGVLVSSKLIDFENKGQGLENTWVIAEEDLVRDDVQKGVLTDIVEGKALVGRWFAEQISGDSEKWFVGTIVMATWQPNHELLLKVGYPGLYIGETGKGSIMVHRNIVIRTASPPTSDVKIGATPRKITSGENNTFKMTTNRVSLSKQKVGSIIVFKRKMLGVKGETQSERLSLTIQHADIAQRTHILTQREQALSDAQGHFEKTLVDFESERSHVHTANTQTATDIEVRMKRAESETNEYKHRLQTIRHDYEADKAKVKELSDNHISELRKKLVRTEQQLEALMTATTIADTTREKNRIAANLASEKTIRDLSLQITKADQAIDHWRSMVEEHEHMKADPVNDKRTDQLEESLLEAQQTLRDYEARYKDLHSKTMESQEKTDTILRQHEEFVKQATKRSENLLTSLKESEDKYNNLTKPHMHGELKKLAPTQSPMYASATPTKVTFPTPVVNAPDDDTGAHVMHDSIHVQESLVREVMRSLGGM